MNHTASSMLARLNLQSLTHTTSVPKRAWFGCVRETCRTETKTGPKWGLRAACVVRINDRKGPHSAPFRSLSSTGKRMSRMGRLAEGQVLRSNILLLYINDLSGQPERGAKARALKRALSGA